MGKVKQIIQSLPLSSNKVTSSGKIKKAKEKFNKQKKVNLPLNKNTSSDSLLNSNANLINLKKDNSLEAVGLKSLKLQKSGKRIKKKEKLNLKRKLLMKKIDTIKEMKKEEKIREKRKKTTLIGDTNPLHDALPSLESLLEHKKEVNLKVAQQKKKKGIEKSKHRKKKLISDIDLFKRAINDKTFKKNPFEIISNHVQAVVEQQHKQINR